MGLSLKKIEKQEEAVVVFRRAPQERSISSKEQVKTLYLLGER